MPHVPPVYDPPPPPPPLVDDHVQLRIDATFDMAIASVILIAVILLGLGFIVFKLSAIYDKIPQGSEGVSSSKEVKVEAVSSSGGISTVAKLAHVLSVLVSGVIALCVGTVLADGTSVIILKDPFHLPIITNPALKSIGINHRADELLGPTYGIGLFHDQSGAFWTDIRAEKTLAQLEHDLGLEVISAALPSVIATDGVHRSQRSRGTCSLSVRSLTVCRLALPSAPKPDLKHPVPFLQCKNLQHAGLTAFAFGIIAEVVAVLMILFHAVALTGLVPAKIVKMLGGLVWFVLTGGFFIVVMIALCVYTHTWTCDNTIVPTIKLSDHFDYNYGFAFAIIGFVSSLLIFVVQLVFTSTKEDDEAPALGGALVKTVFGLVLGLVVITVGALISLGANNYFEDPAPIDPNINPCESRKPYNAVGMAGNVRTAGDRYFDNVDCMKDTVTQTLEQAGGNVTKGYVGGFNAHDRVPITKHYSETDLCPVNVHWHLGAEHLSVGALAHSPLPPPLLHSMPD